MTETEQSDISYYAGEAIADLEFPAIGDGRTDCDRCGRQMTFDPKSYALAKTLGESVRKLCRPCLEAELGDSR